MASTIQICVILFVAFSSLLDAQTDAAGSNDHRFFERLKNFYIKEYKVSGQDEYIFLTSEGRDIKVRGTKTFINYYAKSGVITSDECTILNNIKQKVLKLGGQVMHTDKHNIHILFENENSKTWIHAHTWCMGKGCEVVIVECGR